VLTPFGDKLILHWIGTDDDNSPNYATVGFTSQNAAPLQVLPVSNGVLTVDGDQRALGFDDTVTIERAASGGVKLTVNGQVAEYAPGDLTAITVNPGGGINTVKILATFPGVALTINGGGTDRISFGASPPADITYTPDASGRSGYGTLSAGGQTIQ